MSAIALSFLTMCRSPDEVAAARRHAGNVGKRSGDGHTKFARACSLERSANRVEDRPARAPQSGLPRAPAAVRLLKNRSTRARGARSRRGSHACTISSPEPPASSASGSSRRCWPGAAPSSTSCCARKARARSPALLEYWGVDGGSKRAVPVYGDLTAKKLGVSADDIKKLKGQVDHVYHLAAVYDLSADAESQIAVNIEGTRDGRSSSPRRSTPATSHHVSSIAAAGLYEGVFREDMFDEAEGLDHPYFMTKHESEKIVRKESKVPWTVYRPALVVGDSQTGEMDKIDGPYYFFKLIQRMRQLLPPWMPSVGIEGGRINIVPVDFVVAALDHISHLKTDLDERCFHLVDPVGYRVGDVLDIFSKAAHAPKMNLFVNAALLGFIPKGVKKGMMALAPVRRMQGGGDEGPRPARGHAHLHQLPDPLRLPRGAGGAEGLGHRVPEARRLRLAPVGLLGAPPRPGAADRPLAARARSSGKVVLVTGGSSGIGLAAACKFAEAGAITVICARDEAKLVEAKREILDEGRQGRDGRDLLGRHRRRGRAARRSSTGSTTSTAASTS